MIAVIRVNNVGVIVDEYSGIAINNEVSPIKSIFLFPFLLLLQQKLYTSRGNRNLTNYLEGSYTNRYTILVVLIKTPQWNRTNINTSEV